MKYTLNDLMYECISRNYNVSVTYQRINDYSVEIYRGYKTDYELIKYIDGCIDIDEVIKLGMQFLNDK